MKHLALFMMFLLGSSPAILAQKPDRLSQIQFAASQHEIVSVLIQEGRYAQVLPEFSKILDLDLSGHDEKLVVQSVWNLSQPLRERREYSLAHQMVGQTLQQTEERQNKFYLLMLKGKLFQEEGRLSEALEVYKQAQSLK